ncbi:hypothetical protein AB0N05_29690 [Nocardia sp. NPDC051030]|uniref:hypothetical protein n=1 Tax=Nocardia sp. NPDC051030 TaxID=3155162 RepID=UPI003443E615
MIRRKYAVGLLASTGMLLGGSLGVAGWNGYGAWQDQQVDDARTDSVLVARRAAEGMFGSSFDSTATIEAAGVISASADHAEVMVLLNQKSVGKDPSKGTDDQTRLRVKLDKRDGRWLVADVDPI